MQPVLGSTYFLVAGASNLQEEEEFGSSHVFGCYSAVALADARALHAFRSLLGSTLLADRHWQQGAYTCEVCSGSKGHMCVRCGMQSCHLASQEIEDLGILMPTGIGSSIQHMVVWSSRQA
eukprot:1156647-Pelagomonas_calceolata.AAC.14